MASASGSASSAPSTPSGSAAKASSVGGKTVNDAFVSDSASTRQAASKAARSVGRSVLLVVKKVCASCREKGLCLSA